MWLPNHSSSAELFMLLVWSVCPPTHSCNLQHSSVSSIVWHICLDRTEFSHSCVWLQAYLICLFLKIDCSVHVFEKLSNWDCLTFLLLSLWSSLFRLMQKFMQFSSTACSYAVAYLLPFCVFCVYDDEPFVYILSVLGLLVTAMFWIEESCSVLIVHKYLLPYYICRT